MPREFYTEKDIEDLFKAGTMSLQVNDQTVLTELAYEKARVLGVTLVRDTPDNPPSAPVRPYLSQVQARGAGPKPADPVRLTSGVSAGGHIEESPSREVDLAQRIRQAVVARLGTQVDAPLLDVIIKRVLAVTGVK